MSKKETLHIYKRVSSSRQEKKGYSLEDQQLMGEKFSKENNLTTKVWNEGGRSSNHNWDELEKKRPVLYQLIDEIDKENVKYLFVINEDRLFRTSDVRTRLTLKLIRNDIQIYTEKGKYSFENSTDRVMFQIWSIFSEEENIKRRKLSVQGKISGMKRGHWKGGDINFGYKLVDKKLQINKEESVHVKEMFEMYEKGKSTKDIQNYLLKNNIKTRRNNSIFPLQSITNILKNTIYIGYKDMRITDFHYRFECPSIIREDLFHKVQLRMKDILERKNQINRTKNQYLLREYLYCKCCKNPISGRITKQGHSYYFCSNRNRLWKGYKNGKEKCRMNRSLNIQHTDFMVWETICDLLENSVRLREEFKSKSLQSKFKSDKEVSNEVRRVRGRIRRISREINDMNENLLLIEKQKWTNKMEEKTYNEVKNSIMNEIQNLESEREDRELTITDTLTQKNWLNWIKRYSKKIEKVRDTFDIQVKKDVLGELLQRINVDWDTEMKEHLLDIRLKLPLFNDRLEYRDKSNKSEGYELLEGSKRKLVRYKKTNNVKRFIDDVKKKDDSNVQTNGISHRRIGSFVHLENGQNHYLNINLKTKSQLLYRDGQSHYNSYQEFLYELCKTLKRKGLGYRKISYYLKEHGYKSVRGKELKNNSVYSILKKGKIRKDRIKNLKSHKDYGYTFDTELTTMI